MNIIEKLYYDRIGDYEEIDVYKTSESKEYDICHCWYLLHKGFKLQTNVCNRRHDLLIMSPCTLAILLF